MDAGDLFYFLIDTMLNIKLARTALGDMSKGEEFWEGMNKEEKIAWSFIGLFIQKLRIAGHFKEEEVEKIAQTLKFLYKEQPWPR